MTMGEPFAVPMSSLPQPLTGPVRWHQLRLAAAVLCFAAAVVTIVSTFSTLYFSEMNSGDLSFSIAVTAWGYEITGIPEFGETPTTGYPLIFAGIALICAATTGAFAAMPTATPGGHRVAGLVTAIATAFLAGTVWTVAVQASSWVDSFDGADQPLSTDLSAGFGAGFWLLLVAVLAALVAAVLALLPPSQRRHIPTEPDFSTANLPTPPYGFAVVVELPREPPPYAPPLVDQPAPTLPAEASPAPTAAALSEAERPPVPVAEPLAAIQPLAPAVAPSPTAEPTAMGNPAPTLPGPAPAEQPAEAPGPAVPAVEDPLAPPLDERTLPPR